MLTPKWELLASELKHTVKVAYWDTETNGQTPPLLGQIKGTPTIKAFVPSRKSARNDKSVIDYEQAREVKDLVRFATSRMPNYVERVKSADDLAAVQAKREEWGLPMVLVLSTSGSTSSTLKALSTEYRRRLLVVEHKADKGSAVAARFGVTKFSAVLGFRVPGSGDDEAPVRFEKEPTFNRLCAPARTISPPPDARFPRPLHAVARVRFAHRDTFFGKMALKKAVLKKPAKDGAKEEL